MTQDDQTWAAQAACATVEPDQLFGKGAEQRDARSLCFSCPVRMECLAEALNSESSFGVWGGLTERERRALLRRFPEVDRVEWMTPDAARNRLVKGQRPALEALEEHLAAASGR